MDGSEITRWLLEGDPSIRWQVKANLLDADPADVAAERARVSSDGWGAELLSRQDAEGTWAGGAYNPKWTSTFYTLVLLRQLGLEPGEPRAARGMQILLDRGLRADGGLNYVTSVRGRPVSGETCITGMGLALGARFLPAFAGLEPLVANLIREQMADGGWNCQRSNGATHSSFHTTISALDGIQEWEARTGELSPELASARSRCHEFLFAHSLYQSHTTGRHAFPGIARFPFPPQWRYDMLRGLDYLQSVGAPRDPRVIPAIDLLLRARKSDGRWHARAPYRGASWIQVERAGEPGRWNTLRALRVLRWWDVRSESDAACGTAA
ncbi:MAG: hypothetical protein R3B97_16920 [Dehalococcoidia bacterium]|nr:hypothetical protein [Dehalococcoidia bacterium]MCB9485405.1 hypothetical protein [Thermoflexaceae bacterium]